MKIQPIVGLDDLKFGFTCHEVIKLHGDPSSEFVDDFGDLNLCYSNQGFAVKIEKENDDRVGWIMVSNPLVSAFGIQPIGQQIDDVIEHFQKHLSDTVEVEDYGIWTSRTFENSWIEIQETLGIVTQINFGVAYDKEGNIQWPR